ncbi:hypothetical protein BOTBODRAFT_102512 [Botryobasidium botryosum FD-172 SS1]|uniref:Uncharacterized protein n=1 Tax=Botryobasidium botryosum (strain FD-172 SS1) TaxID=930990 RepID=A0A067N6L3_BOTB1|nr:hypothetical protein BOTBODRAFT_102512 [Botryobasidium botryosum FD-172 SS1]
MTSLWLLPDELETLKQELLAGGDIEECDPEGATRLHRAARSADVPLVQLLVDLGADIHARGEYARQPLHYASWGGADDVCMETARSRVTQILLGAGADVDARDGRHETALTRACSHDSYFSIRVLLQGGACPVHRSECPPSTVIKLLQHPNPSEAVTALLKEGVDVNAVDIYGDTLLHHAARLGAPLLVEALLQAFANPVLPGKMGQCVLHHAVSLVEHPGGIEAVTLLYVKGADINAKDGYGQTPLFRAAMRGGASAVLLLGKLGANPSLSYNNGVALHHAAKLVDHPAGEEAITALANTDSIHTRDGRGCTPLCETAWGGKPAAVLLLLKLGADPSLPCWGGHVPLHHAHKLIGHPDGEEAITALAHPSNIHIKNGVGHTPLCEAAWGGKPAAVLLLLKLGADPSLPCESGYVPLHHAAKLVDHPAW